MIMLYHLNYGCKDRVPGHVFDLIPINIAAGPEHAAAYEGWKRAWPDYLSVIGYWYMTPDQPFGVYQMGGFRTGRADHLQPRLRSDEAVGRIIDTTLHEENSMHRWIRANLDATLRRNLKSSSSNEFQEFSYNVLRRSACNVTEDSSWRAPLFILLPALAARAVRIIQTGNSTTRLTS